MGMIATLKICAAKTSTDVIFVEVWPLPALGAGGARRSAQLDFGASLQDFPHY